MRRTSKYAAIAICILACVGCGRKAALEEFAINETVPEGELSQRLIKNLKRLESPIYRPDAVFKEDDWPGDFVGRTILGTTLNVQASHRHPMYLGIILSRLPSKFNGNGYLGPVYDVKDEQQLSGHGWLLRGLCEYYEMTSDRVVLDYIESIVKNLFIPGKEFYLTYPTDPSSRTSGEGAESGSILDEVSGWRLSSDIGCVFIGMSGLIHAYQILSSLPETSETLLKDMKEIIDILVSKFDGLDLVGIKAQTHATLTACCGLVRYYEITDERKYLELACRTWETYLENGMTCNYENYNWFDRKDCWTEPCAIIDSYILACKLWEHTGLIGYRDMAELIYYNAICHTQRSNGGFGCDTCPSETDKSLSVHADEAYWCCTMRGGEGLARVCASTYLHEGKTLVLGFFRKSMLEAKDIRLKQSTDYPFGSSVEIEILENKGGYNAVWFPFSPWIADISVTVNGRDAKISDNTLKKRLKKGDRIRVDFKQIRREEPWYGLSRIMEGPLILGGEDLSPVYHMMDSTVRKHYYKKQILF